MSRYNEIYQRTWESKSFKALSKPKPNAQTLWLYLLTGRVKTPLPGIYGVGLGALSDYLKWSMESLTESFKELSDNDMAKCDSEYSVIYLPNWYKWNKPQNPNVLKSWMSLLDNIPDCNYKSLYLQQLKSLCESLGDSFTEAFTSHYGNHIANPVPVPVPVPVPKPKTEPNKEDTDKSDLPPFSISLSELVFNHAGVNPTKKQIHGGAEVINDIHRLDGYKPDEIEEVIKWALDDEFWKRNVLSPASLRKKKNGAGDFTKFQKIYNQWKNKPLTDAEIAQQTIDRLNERERLRNEGKNVL